MSDVPPPVEQDQGTEAPIMPRSEFSVIQDLDYSTKLREDTDRAFAAGDHVNGYKLLEQQQREAQRSSLEIAMEGGDPVTQVTPRAAFNHPLVETQRRAEMLSREEKLKEEAINRTLPQVLEYWHGNVMGPYYKNNSAPLKQPIADMTPEETVAYHQQFQPTMVDPNVHADMNAMIFQMDKDLKAINPTASVYTDSRTKDVALWMLQEAEPGRPGYFETGPQPFDYGAGIEIPLVPKFVEYGLGYGAQLGVEALEGLSRPLFSLVDSVAAFGLDAIGKITGGEPTDYWNAPTNGIDTTAQLLQMFSMERHGGDDDKIRSIMKNAGWLDNSGKVNPEVGHILEMNKLELDHVMEKQAHALGKAREWKHFQETGGEWLTMGMANLAGSLVTFMATAGRAWQAGGNVAIRGMSKLGLAEKGTTLRKVQEVVTRTSGAAIAGGLYDGVAYGRAEGFSSAMVHGMQVVPLYTAIGAMGAKIARALTKKGFSPRVAAKISGVADGVGIGALEVNDLTPLYRFLQNGEERDWAEFGGIILKNVLVMMMMKKGGPTEMYEQLGILGEFEAAIKITAREAYETKDPARREEILKAGEEEGWSREKMLDIGRRESEAAAARAVDPEATKEAREGAEQAVKDATRAKEGIDEPKEVRAEKKWQAEEETQRMRREAETPEERAEAEARTEEEQRLREIKERKLADFEVREEPTKKPPEEPTKLGALASRKGMVSSQDIPLRGGKEQYKPSREKVKPITREDLRIIVEGRPARRGIPGAPGRLGSRKGDPIQLPPKGGRKTFRKEGIRATVDELKVAKVGEYDPRTEAIKLDDAYDMNTLLHEMAHQMMKKTVGFDWQPTAPKAMVELLDLARPMSPPNHTQKQRIAEGWAEFFSRDILGDANLQAKSPTLYKELMEWMAEKSNRPLLQQYQRMTDAFERWRAQGEKVRGYGEFEPPKIGKGEEARKPRKLKTKIEKEQAEGFFDTVERLAGKWVDDVHEFRRAYNKWMKLAGQDPSKTPIILKPADMYDALKMTAPRVAEFMLDGAMVDINNNPIGKSMKEILKQIAPEEFRDFWLYMKRKREMEMDDQGIVVPDFDRGSAHRLINELERPHFQEASNQIRNFFHQLIDYVMASGGYSAEQAQRIKAGYQTYIPFHRIYDSVIGGDRGRRGDPIRRVRGGTQAPILDPATAIRETVAKLVAHAQQSALLRSLHDHHLFTEGQGGFVTDVTRKVEAREIKLGDIADQLDKVMLPGDKKHEAEYAADILRGLDIDGVLNFHQAVMPEGEPNIIGMRVNYTKEDIAYRVKMKAESKVVTTEELAAYEKSLHDSNGKIRWLQLDSAAYKMMMGVEGVLNMPPMVEAFLRPFVGAARIVRAGATVLNPKFVLRNTIRDTQQQGMYSKHGSFIPMTGVNAFIRGGFAAPELKAKFESMGGKGTTFIGQEVLRPESTFRLQGREIGPVALARKALNKVAEFINAGESFIRRREFELTRQKLMAEGKSEYEANLQGLLDAKEVTVNFTRSSSLLRAINGVYPYFNAGVQGSRKFVRHLSGYEGKDVMAQSWLRGTTHLTAMSALVQLLHGKEGWYQDLNEWQRRAYWNFKFPGDDEPYALPKPFQAGWLFTVPFEIVMDEIRGAEQPLDLNDAIFENFLGMFFNDFKILPSLVGPGMEVGITKQGFSEFTRREIVPSWMVQHRKPKDRFNVYTTRTAKWIGESLGVSPLKVEHFLSAHTGGIGAGLLEAADVAFMGKEPSMPRVLSYRFTSRSVRELYRTLDEMSQAAGSDELTRVQRRFRGRMQRADQRMDRIRDRAERGDITDIEAAKQQAEIARPVMRDYRRAQ